jgi:hypothetical protein
VDYVDFGAAFCDIDFMAPDCCARPVGACSPGNPVFGACIETNQVGCETGTNGGTWHGDNTICYNDAPLVIPAASTWGLLALAISVLIGGTLLIRPRIAVS